MFTSSLFPEHTIFENGRNEAQAVRLAHQLRDVDLQVLATTPDRRSVVARLRREGIDNAMQFVLLTEEEVMGWYNVGPVFFALFCEMRQEIISDPERIVRDWRDRVRLFILPDDLSESHDEDDFFGVCMEEEMKDYGRPKTICSPVAELERSLVAAIEMLTRRSDEGEVVRRYYLEGMSVESIVSSQQLASNASLYRIVDRHFSEPLLKGYAVCGIEFSDSLLSVIRKLKKDLVYSRLSELDELQRIPPQRFLHFLGLSILQRTTAEGVWMVDYIVREGDIQRCRLTLRDLLSSLQWRVVAAKENALRRGMQALRRKGGAGTFDVEFMRVLLRDHPSIEVLKKGYRLIGESLVYDSVRLARIVYDAHGPITLPELLARYERLYFERPRTVSIANVRQHFPQVHSIRRGVWEWQ